MCQGHKALVFTRAARTSTFIYVLAHEYTCWRFTVANITLTVPEDLKSEIQKHKEVNWSEVTRKAMKEHLRKIHLAEAIASKSKLTKKDIEELDKLVKKGIAKAHGL